MRQELHGEGRSRSLARALAPAGLVLALVGCSSAEGTGTPAPVAGGGGEESVTVDVPSSPPTTTAAPSAPGPSATASAGLPTFTSVQLLDASPADGDESAVLVAYGGFWDDWMAVAAAPREPVPASEHADGRGQAVLDQLAVTLTQAGNGIEGTMVMDEPVVSFDEVRQSAAVSSCADQAELEPVLFDGSPGAPEAQSRLRTEVALARSAEGWKVSGLDITSAPC